MDNKDKAEQTQPAGAARQGGITSLEGLTRYSFGSNGESYAILGGAYVKFDDVAAALASQSQAAPSTIRDVALVEARRAVEAVRGAECSEERNNAIFDAVRALNDLRQSQAAQPTSGPKLANAIAAIDRGEEEEGEETPTIYSREEVVEMLKYEIILDNAARELLNGDSVEFNLGEWALLANRAAHIAGTSQATQPSIEKAARALAEHVGWKQWDTATDCTHTPGGNDPEDEREYWRDLARVAIESAGTSQATKAQAEPTFAQRLYGPTPSNAKRRDALYTMALIFAASETDSAREANFEDMWREFLAVPRIAIFDSLTRHTGLEISTNYTFETEEFFEVEAVERILGASVAKEATLDNVAPGTPSASQVLADEAQLYRDLTGDATKMGFDGIVAALRALRAATTSTVSAPAAVDDERDAVDPNVFFDALSDYNDSPMSVSDGQRFYDKLNESAPSGTEGAPAVQAEYVGKLRSALYAIANTLEDGELRSSAKEAYDLAAPISTEGAQKAPEEVREAVARAIWNIRREDEDRCDMELEDMGTDHPVWTEADAAIRALRTSSTDQANADTGSAA